MKKNKTENIALSIVIPSYMEAENLKELLPVLKDVLLQMGVLFEVLIVDTQEQMDDTQSVCEKQQVRYISRQGGNTYGDAIRSGIEKADGKRILIMDGDGSHSPQAITDLYQKSLEGYTLVIGSRYTAGGDNHNNWLLTLMSWTVNTVYRVIFHLKVKDVSNSFRLYVAKDLKALALYSDNFDIVEEIIIKMNNKNLKNEKFVVEVPIYFDKRKYGKSKRNLVKFIFSYLKSIYTLYCLCDMKQSVKHDGGISK